MINVIVCRGAAASAGCPLNDPNLSWGNDISDPLLTTDLAAQERGRVEIDKTYSNRNIDNLVLYQLEYIQPGKMYSLVEPLSSDTGLVTSFDLTISKTGQNTFTAQTSINMEFNT
jgi:hypothetical protein